MFAVKIGSGVDGNGGGTVPQMILTEMKLPQICQQSRTAEKGMMPVRNAWV